jgi:predicted RNase H-like HicB family nuclease/DNA-binding XRE family transcriptional regulator
MRYHALITREGKQHLAEFADAPGCQTFAGSEAALREASREALEGWLEAHLESGDVPPRPGRRPSAAGVAVWTVDVAPRLAVSVELRWAREDAGLTQAEVAQRAGVPVQQIAKLERPDESPTVDSLVKVAAALGVPLEIRVGPRVRPVRRAPPPPARRAVSGRRRSA